MFDELVVKAREGDKDSIEEILNRLKPLIVSSIRKYYNKPNEYEDLIQDGNLKIIECIGDFDSTKGVYFLGYVKTMLRYLYLDKHKQKLTISLNESLPDGETELIDTLISEDKHILDMVLEMEDKLAVEKALADLTKRQREIVVLFFIEEMKIEEISNLLGISYRTVVNTKARALEKLREKGTFY